MITEIPLKENSSVQVIKRQLENNQIIIIKKFKDQKIFDKEFHFLNQLKKIALPFKKYSDNSLEFPFYLSLESLLRQPISPGYAKKISLQLINILKTLKESEVTHGDLKPSNIFVTDEKEIKINDFETAQSKKFPPKQGRSSGTPGYAAPEAWVNSSLDWLADQYSIGIILCQIYCLQRPFNDLSPNEIYESQKNQQVNPGALNPDISPTMSSIIQKMCAFDKLDRFNSIGEIIESIQATPVQRVKQQILTDERSVVISSEERSTPKWLLIINLVIFLLAIAYLIFR